MEHHVVRYVDGQYLLICGRCRKHTVLTDTAVPVLIAHATHHDKEHHDGQPARPRHEQPG